MIKRAFTLLEILVCLAILSLIGSGVGWQIHRMIASHRFWGGADQLCIALQEAQLLAVVHQTDFRVRIFQDKATVWYQIETFEPLKAIDQRPRLLPEVASFSVQGNTEKEITLTLYASGRIEPPGFIGLHPPHAKRKISPLWIDLQTPIQIKLRTHKPPALTAQHPPLPKERKS